MIIMFEGVDGSGKSTLKKELIKEIKLKYPELVLIENGETLIPTHPAKPGRLTPTQLVKTMTNMMRDTDKVYICDRGPISDVIYRTFDDYEPLLNLGELVFWLTAYNTSLLIIWCDSNKSEQLMLERGDENPIAIQRHKELRYLFRQIIMLFQVYHYDVDIQGNNMSDPINSILTKLLSNIKILKERGKKK